MLVTVAHQGSTSGKIRASQQDAARCKRVDIHNRSRLPALCIMKLVSAVLISLTAAVGRTHAMIRDPTPEIWTENLPQGICSVDGNYLLPDVSDNTSYYTCCGQQVTIVRKTCRYVCLDGGYEPPLHDMMLLQYISFAVQCSLTCQACTRLSV